MAEKDPNFYETITAEHKIGIPSKLELARDIAAFANTQGGHLFIGHIPTEEGLHSFTGLTDGQIQEVKERVEDALHFLRPKPLINIVEDTTLGKSYQFVVINVQKYSTPVVFEDGRYYVRRGNTTTIAEEELIDALSEAVPSFISNILNSLHSEEPIAEKSEETTHPAIHPEQYEVHSEGEIQSMITGEGNTATHHFTNIVREKIEEIPHLDLTNLLSESIKRTREDLTIQRNDRLQQAQITFIVALVVLILAIVLVFIGVILIFINKAQQGIVSSVASIVSGIVSGLVLAFNKQTNDRLDEYARELVVLEKSYTGMQYISLITDIKIKDEAICDLAKSISMGSSASK